jgi:uncharacterized damage-inducible protein DinB
MSLASTLIADFNDEASMTRTVLEAVPEDQFDFKPHEKSMSLGQLAGHLAENPAWLHSMMEEEMDFETDMGDYQPFVPSTKAELMEVFDKNTSGFPGMLAERNDEFLKGTFTMKNGESIFMQRPRHLALRSTGIHHMIHHRGQLGVYLRLLNVASPSIYGPTADDAMGFPVR